VNPVADILARGRVLLAPMAGVTEAPFRAICKRFGAGLTYTEMVSVKALYYAPDSTRTRELLTFAPEETPCAVQVFGSDPALMAEQVALLAERYRDQIAVVDINMGCPVTKVVAKGEGSALMRTPELAAEIVAAVAAAVSPLPVTVKFRKGWDEGSANAVEFAQRMEAAGAAAIAVHGRTRDQFYRGSADWRTISQVKEAVDVPVIGSGDVFSAADVVSMIEQTGVDAVMVARGAQGNPWIFREARALTETGETIPGPTPTERVQMALEHSRALVEFGGEHAVIRMRKHVGWYVAGLPGASYVRTKVNQSCTYAELEAMLLEYADFLANHTAMMTEGQ